MTEQFFFKNLNPEQKEAVDWLDGPLLVMAGAGSGKTRVLTYRIANLIAQGISPFNILAITFTNKAANEMKTRAEKLIGAPAKNVVLSTFHSLCARLLRREIKITGNFSSSFAIYDTSDTKTLLKLCVKELNLSDNIFDKVHNKISSLKNNLISPAQFKEKISYSGNTYESNVAIIYELYQKKLQENNALDFDDLIFTTVKIFQNFPVVLEKYQERFLYILIDEYQDTNNAQYVLTRLLADKYKNLCVVGDADQSIYGWRGADMNNILNFKHDYPNAKVIFLEQNYRSTKTILNAANSVIRNNLDREPKNLWTQNELGEKIKLGVFDNDRMEVATVAKEIQRLVEQEKFLYSDIALLYRTNAQSRLFEEKFMQAEIPYSIVGGLKFYDRKEIKDILAYLHVIANPRDDLHLLRIINTPRRGLGSINVNRLAEFASSQELSILEVVTDRKLFSQAGILSPKFRANIKDFAVMMISFMGEVSTLSIDKLIITVLNESGYMKMIRDSAEDGKAENISREENLGTFVDGAKEFVENNPDGTLEDFLNHVALISDMDTLNEKDSRVKLMTVHAAKGLEFPIVFVVGMEDGIFPHASSFESEAELAEERRACYVALTRAKKKVYITAAYNRMFFGKNYDQVVSRFVEEIPKSYIESFGVKPNAPLKEFTPTSTYKPPTAHRDAQSKVAEKKSGAPIDLRVGDMINHKKWGLGMVMQIESGISTINFTNPEIGVKKLVVKVAPINKV